MTGCNSSQINRKKTLNLSEKAHHQNVARKKKNSHAFLWISQEQHWMRWEAAGQGASLKCRMNSAIIELLPSQWTRCDEEAIQLCPKRERSAFAHRCSQPDNNNVVCAAQSIFFSDGWHDYLKLFPFFLNNYFSLIFWWNCRVSR